jgi:hypothetical protein
MGCLIPQLCPVPSVSLRNRFAPQALRWDNFAIVKVSHGAAGVLTGGNRGNREMPRLLNSVASVTSCSTSSLISIGSCIAQFCPVPSISLRNQFTHHALRWDNFRTLKVSHERDKSHRDACALRSLLPPLPPVRSVNLPRLRPFFAAARGRALRSRRKTRLFPLSAVLIFAEARVSTAV